MWIGACATVPEIRVSVKVEATTGGKAADDVATAILIETGSDVAMIRNSGASNAKVGGDDAVARAIVDLTGHVAMVENSGAISATGAKDAADNIAIDLSANNGGATVKQTAVASGATAPSITGNVPFGNREGGV